ncbi:MAG: 50S ribosomal protein L35 [Planctomycetota bacterium]|nr:MAG: 50S ribosomal protein L35 [Planctomycetota bacterium]
MAKGPKMKSHKASRRRLRVTRNGKILRTQGGVRHLMTHRSPKRKRNLRKKATMVQTAIVRRFQFAHYND